MRRVTAIEEAAAVLRAGGVIAIPTDTLYGLAADPFNPVAVARLFAIKGRDAERAVPLVAADVEQVTDHFGPLPAAGERLAAAFWPGPLTLLVHAPKTLAANLTGGQPTVGVRVPDHAVTRELCRACARPLTATSANMSGEPATADPEEVVRTIGERIDLLLDGGRTPGGPPSTIVDISGSSPRLVRSGAVPWEEVVACVQRT
jgi:L-threonylcarbamoyladenylate synthase